MREDFIGMMIFLALTQNRIPEISSLTNSYAERKNVGAKALALAAKAQAAGVGYVVDIV